MTHHVLLFAILSIPILYFSRKPLRNIHNHGFPRFFGWECTLWMLISNLKHWFTNPLSIGQVFSWILLILSAYYIAAGIYLLVKTGKPQRGREETALYDVEKTTRLVETGLYRYIRHPIYGSLILLTWGAYLKNTTIDLLAVALAATVLYYLTAILDEKECMAYFGDDYSAYMKRSKMFLPLLL